MCLSDWPHITAWTMADTMWMDAFSLFKRRKSLGDYYLDFEDLDRVIRGFHDVNFRYVLAPSKRPPIKGFVPIAATREEV